jgi:1-acyl-sn-glycerol-3-phosphate acyltransferase
MSARAVSVICDATPGVAAATPAAIDTTPAIAASHSTDVCPRSRMSGPWHCAARRTMGRRAHLRTWAAQGRASVPAVTDVQEDERLAPIKAQVYKDPRPPEAFARFHERSRTRKPDIVYEIVRVVTTLFAWVLFRVRGIDPERVPAGGPVILAPNHASFMDHFLLGASIRRKVQFMAKSQLFKPPMQFVYSHGGVFPVRRGHRDEETFITASTILDRGGCIAMYCEGGRSRTGKVGDVARPGIGRLALESGATIVPVAIHGSVRVRNWRRLEFPSVTVKYGTPFRYERVEEATRDQQQAVADVILAEIRELYDALDAEGRASALARARAERRARRAKRTAAI